ncbi:hypothetical protein GCM10027416_01410 [Okibacterium endophyticum]
MPSEDASALTPTQFQEAMAHFASGVTVITTRVDGVDFGTTASAVSSVANEPPMLMVCLRRDSAGAGAIEKAQVFAVNVLAEDQVGLAGRFAVKAPDKYTGVDIRRGVDDVPLLEGALAHLACRVSDIVDAATHRIFIAHVVTATASPGRPLTYFRGTFGRLESDPDAAALRAVREHLMSLSLDDEITIDPVALSAHLRIEQGLVQHALRTLASESLLRREGSLFVMLPVPDSVLFDHYTAKLTLEIGVAELTVGQVDDDRLHELRRRMEATLDRVQSDRFDDPASYVDANDAFHEYMVELAGSRAAVEAYRRLGMRSLEHRTISGDTYTTRDVLDDHREIVEGYERGDLAAVLAALRRHATRPREMRALQLQAATPPDEGL